MKKVTGKALSLVLSIALVASGFSASFASASSKTVTGSLKGDYTDEFYLVNGGTLDSQAVANFQDDISTNAALETKEHNSDIDDTHIASVSHVSGDRLVKWTENDDDAVGTTDDSSATLKLTLRSKDETGTEVLAVLYKGTYTDDDDNTITVKAQKNITVHVLDAGSVVIGDAGYDPNEAGDEPSIDDFATRTAAYESSTKTDADAVKTDNRDLSVYKASTAGDSALAVWAPVQAEPYVSGTTPVAGSIYTVKSSNSTLLALSGTPGTTIHAQVAPKASAANITLTASVVSDAAVTSAGLADKDDVKAKAKLVKEIKVTTADAAYRNLGRTKGKTYLYTDGTLDVDAATRIDVSGYGVNFEAPAIDVTVGNDANVGDITGQVASLTIGEDTSVSSVDFEDGGNVAIDSAKVGDVETDEGNVIVSGDATVGKIDAETDAAAGDVTVNGGKTGDISADGIVTVQPTEDDVTATVGAVTSADIVIDSADSKATVGSWKATGDGKIQLSGDNVTIGAIDFDYRGVTLESSEDLDSFQGTIPAPQNATDSDASIATNYDDDSFTITGNVDVQAINLVEDSKVVFTGSVKVVDMDGDGTIVFGAGKLYVDDSISGTILKLSDTSLSKGETVFTAATDCVDVDDATPYGFTLAKSEGRTIDTFTVDSLEFAGININKASSQIAKGYSETFTAAAYAPGTQLPAGYSVAWDLDDNDGIFTLTTNADGSATVTAVDYDPTFADENKATLVAYLVDEDGVEDEDYAEANCDLTALLTPAVNFVSDTPAAINVASGSSYQFKFTSADGSAPTSFGVGSAALGYTYAGASGNAYFYKITATGAAGQSVGVYLNGVRVCVVTITGATVKTDTPAAISVTKGSTYQFKVTGVTGTVSYTSGNSSVVSIASSKVVGSDHFFTVKAVGTAGQGAGVYVNGVRVCVVTVK